MLAYRRYIEAEKKSQGIDENGMYPIEYIDGGIGTSTLCLRGACLHPEPLYNLDIVGRGITYTLILKVR